MLHEAMARREDGDDLVGARDRLRVDHDCAWVHVAEEGHLARAIGIHGPEAVVVDLAAVNVLPARVEDAAIVQQPRGVVVL